MLAVLFVPERTHVRMLAVMFASITCTRPVPGRHQRRGSLDWSPSYPVSLLSPLNLQLRNSIVPNSFASDRTLAARSWWPWRPKLPRPSVWRQAWPTSCSQDGRREVGARTELDWATHNGWLRGSWHALRTGSNGRLTEIVHSHHLREKTLFCSSFSPIPSPRYRIHSIFHVSQLKPYTPDYALAGTEPENLAIGFTRWLNARIWDEWINCNF